jgi:multiple sugar transport system ATP-binding protein
LPPGTDQVIAGIRPEHFRLGEADDDGAFRSRAGVVEWLGADVFVHVDITVDLAGTPALRRELLLPDDTGDAAQALPVVARIASDATTAAGDDITLAIDPAGLVLFDADSGARLGADEAATALAAGDRRRRICAASPDPTAATPSARH